MVKMLKVGDSIVWVNTRTRYPLYGKITGETGKRWKVSGTNDASKWGSQFVDNKKRYMVEKSKAHIWGRSRSLVKVKEQYKKLSWSDVRRKELEKLLPSATGAQPYYRKSAYIQGWSANNTIGFILNFKDGKEKKFPYPRVDGRIQDEISFG